MNRVVRASIVVLLLLATELAAAAETAPAVPGGRTKAALREARTTGKLVMVDWAKW
jgi:hypothetical protein